MINYKVQIQQEVYDKIMFWVHKSPVEVSGMGKVQFIDGLPVVTEAYLVEQENSASDTELDGQALAKLMFQTKDDAGHLNFWWHSHVNMGVFWSATDWQAIKQLGSKGWVVATVFNKKAEQRTCIYQGGSDIFPPILSDEIDLEIYSPASQELHAIWEAEYTAKCKQKTYKPSTNAWGNSSAKYGGYGYGWEDMPKKEEPVRLLDDKASGMVALPYRKFASDGALDIYKLSYQEQLKWAKRYFELYGYEADEWHDLELIYKDYSEWTDSDFTLYLNSIN